MNKERVALLRKRVSKDPYDAASWESLVSEADRARRGSERNAELTSVYEDLLSKFPTAVRTPPPPAACLLPAAALWLFALATHLSAAPHTSTTPVHHPCAGWVLAGVCRPHDERWRGGGGEGGLLPLPAHLPVCRPLARLPQLHQEGGSQ